MRIELKDAKAGDIIVFKGNGFVYSVLSPFLKLYDLSWDKWGWHTGYIYQVRLDGRVTTCEAVAAGVDLINYACLADLGECRIYRWFQDFDEQSMREYTRCHLDDPYDPLVYFWTIFGAASQKYLHWGFRIVNKACMCWENISQMARYCGKEFQPEYEPVLLSEIVKRLESE